MLRLLVGKNEYRWAFIFAPQAVDNAHFCDDLPSSGSVIHSKRETYLVAPYLRPFAFASLLSLCLSDSACFVPPTSSMPRTETVVLTCASFSYLNSTGSWDDSGPECPENSVALSSENECNGGCDLETCCYSSECPSSPCIPLRPTWGGAYVAISSAYATSIHSNLLSVVIR